MRSILATEVEIYSDNFETEDLIEEMIDRGYVVATKADNVIIPIMELENLFYDYERYDSDFLRYKYFEQRFRRFMDKYIGKR
jgi:hypothetical protein